MIVILSKPATKKDIDLASEEYGSFIKITMDTDKERDAIVGDFHANEEGSKQQSIWGGGIDLKSGMLYTNAMVNIDPETNPSPDILNEEIRQRFINIAKKYLYDFTK